MARKGTINNAPRKVMHIPADIKALQSAGVVISTTIYQHYGKQAREGARLRG